jgi:hypothetical protein
MATIIATAVAFAVASAITGEATYAINKHFDHTAEDAAAREKAAEEYRQAQENIPRKEKPSSTGSMSRFARRRTPRLNTKRLTRRWKPTTRRPGAMQQKWLLSLL